MCALHWDAKQLSWKVCDGGGGGNGGCELIKKVLLIKEKLIRCVLTCQEIAGSIETSHEAVPEEVDPPKNRGGTNVNEII